MRRITDGNAYTKLVIARQELLRIRDYVTPETAPRVNLKIRRLIKSVDGAIRNAKNHPATPATVSGVST